MQVFILCNAIVPLALLTLPAFAQDSSLFNKGRQRVADSIGSTQDFVCTVAMDVSSKGGGAAETHNAAQVDAGVINGKELYVNPATDADYKTLTEILTQHARAGTTLFALYLRPVFLTSVASFSPGGTQPINGVQAPRWEFTVPKESSRYALTWNGKPIPLGFSGSYSIDPDKGDMIQSEMSPDDIPKNVEIAEIKQTITYARSKIGGVSVILPTSNVVAVKEDSGRELQIRSKVENCRTFITKPGLRFLSGEVAEEPRTSAGPSTSAPAGKTLPANLTLDTSLEEGIDQKTASPGSAFTLRLAKDVKSGKEVLVRKGAKISGHVTRISRLAYRANTATVEFYVVGVQLDTLDDGTDRYRVAANAELIGPTTTIETFLPYSQDPKKWGRFEDIRDQISFPAQQPGDSLIGLVRPYMRIPSNLRIVWSTVTPK
jgi:hypothetical protein